MPTRLPPLRRAAIRLATLAALTAGVGAPAAAQPACAAGALSGYLAAGFQCQLAGWRFFGFGLQASSADSPGATATAPDALGTTTFLTPFSATDALGRQTFGFGLVGFATDASVAAGPWQGPSTGISAGGATLFFQAESIDPSGVVSHTLLDYLVEGATPTPDLTVLASVVQGVAGPTPTGSGSVCLGFVDLLPGSGGGPRSVEQPCASPTQNSVLPILTIGSNVHQALDALGQAGTTRARIDRIAFVAAGGVQVVPEPATLALVGGGLLALGAAAAARRRRA